MKGKLPAKQEEELVAWVNRQRKGMFSLRTAPPIKRLRPGLPLNGDQCSLARSIGGRARVHPNGWRPTPQAYLRPLPKYVATFVDRFDAGWYPDLVETESP